MSENEPTEENPRKENNDATNVELTNHHEWVEIGGDPDNILCERCHTEPDGENDDGYLSGSFPCLHRQPPAVGATLVEWADCFEAWAKEVQEASWKSLRAKRTGKYSEFNPDILTGQYVAYAHAAMLMRKNQRRKIGTERLTIMSMSDEQTAQAQKTAETPKDSILAEHEARADADYNLLQDDAFASRVRDFLAPEKEVEGMSADKPPVRWTWYYNDSVRGKTATKKEAMEALERHIGIPLRMCITVLDGITTYYCRVEEGATLAADYQLVAPRITRVGVAVEDEE